MYPNFLKLVDMSILDFAIFKPLWLKSPNALRASAAGHFFLFSAICRYN